MRMTHYLSTGLLSLALLSGVSAANAKPQIVEDLERLLPHNQIKRHAENKNETERRFYNDDHRSHSDSKGSKYDRHSGQHNGKYYKGHRSSKYDKHTKYHKYDRHNNNRYYNGWNKGHDRYYGNDRKERRYYYDNRRPHFSVGYWDDHHRHGYRHKRHNGHHYYYDRAGFFFPGFGLIKHGHRHGRHCPEWHLEPFVAGVVLSAILSH